MSRPLREGYIKECGHGLYWEAKLSGGDKRLVNAIGDYVYYLASPSIWVFNRFFIPLHKQYSQFVISLRICSYLKLQDFVMELVTFIPFKNILFYLMCMVRMGIYRTDITIVIYVYLIVRSLWIRKHIGFLGKPCSLRFLSVFIV